MTPAFSGSVPNPHQRLLGRPSPRPLIQLWKVVTANAGRSTAAQTSAHEQWKKVPLLFTRFGGDEKLTSYVRKCFINHEIRIPFLSTCFFLGDIHFPWLFEAFWLKSERNMSESTACLFINSYIIASYEFKSFSPSTHKADPPFAGEGGIKNPILNSCGALSKNPSLLPFFESHESPSPRLLATCDDVWWRGSLHIHGDEMRWVKRQASGWVVTAISQIKTILQDVDIIHAYT